MTENSPTAKRPAKKAAAPKTPIATEFNSAATGIKDAKKTVKEVRSATRNTATTNTRLTRAESTISRHERELKALAERYNNTDNATVQETIADQIRDLNTAIGAFNDDINTQLTQLRKDVGQNTDDIAVQTSRVDDHDISIHMLNTGQQSLNTRVSSISTSVAPRLAWWQLMVAGIVGLIVAIYWNLHVFTNRQVLDDGQVITFNSYADSGVAAFMAFIVGAVATIFVFTLFMRNKKETVNTDTQTVVRSRVNLTPNTPPVRQSVRTTTVPPAELDANPAPTSAFVAEPGVQTGARS